MPVGIFIVFGCVFFGAFLAAGASSFADSHIGAGIAEALVAIVLGGVWLGFAARLFRFGIYVGDSGLRYRGFVRTTDVAWSAVKDVRLAPLYVKWVPFPVADATTICIDRTTGEPIQTWVNNKGAPFLGRRRAFEHAFASLRREVEAHLEKDS